MIKRILIFLVPLVSALFVWNQMVYREIGKGSALLNEELLALEGYLSQMEQLDTAVSKAGVDWHLDHSLKVINRIAEALQASDPEEYRWSINPLRGLVFTTGKMKRGVGKAPKIVQPPEEISKSAILSQLEEARKNLADIDQLDANAHFDHFAFGRLNVKDSKKFLKVHTNHHLSIIRDILGEGN